MTPSPVSETFQFSCVDNGCEGWILLFFDTKVSIKHPFLCTESGVFGHFTHVLLGRIHLELAQIPRMFRHIFGINDNAATRLATWRRNIRGAANRRTCQRNCRANKRQMCLQREAGRLTSSLERLLPCLSHRYLGHEKAESSTGLRVCMRERDFQKLQ